MTKVAARLWTNERGTSAAEFAMVVMLLFVFVFGSINAAMLGFSNMSLHDAVGAAARCRAMNVTCFNPKSTQDYGAAQFINLSSDRAPNFFSDTPVTGTDANCGNRVTGTVNYRFTWLIATQTLPLSAKACFAS